MLRTFRWVLAAAALSASAVAPGCGELRPAVSRVQAGAIDKGVFAGEWYFQQTVIDTPYGASFTFVGEQGELERIRWEVQENWLLARRTYQWIDNADPEGGLGGDSIQQGAIVAAYRIQSHFDVRRDYNPVTGEEQNVIVENTSDRPWYERQFMRVDWSQNMADATDMFQFARILDGIQLEPVQYFVNDPNHPDAPRFEREGATVNYMDIVNRMLVTPTEVNIPGFGNVPTCFLTAQSHTDCAATEVGVRNSFLRADTMDRDYQPMQYTGDRMERFGYFVTERAGYDDQYGTVEGVRYRFANRHNLWQRSHRRSAAGEPVTCRADSDCADGRGSVCDLDLARARRTTDERGRLLGQCTIPYRDRETRPIVYYGPNLPADLWPDFVDFSASWAQGFEQVVDSLRENECLANGGAAADCAAERERADATAMFVPCHSPVIESDADACGAVGTVARIGDLRHSIMGYVSEPHFSSPLGYGPSSADPETGEIIMANAFVYGASMETIASFGRDIVRVLDGDLTASQIQDGQAVQDWLDSVQNQARPAERSAHQHVIGIDGENLDEVVGGMDFSHARPSTPNPLAHPRNLGQAVEAMELARDRLSAAGAFGSRTSAAGRIAQVRGTSIEYDMVENAPELLAAAGLDPRSTRLDADTVTAASILGQNNPALQRAIQGIRNRMNAESCILDANFADEGLLGLARAIRSAIDSRTPMTWYGVEYQLVDDAGAVDWNRVREMLRHPIFHAVTAHEVGHTLGLRHNFSGSFDALNYDPRYWEIRSMDGTMRPRAWDPISQAELDNRIFEHQYSTVMDYGVNFIVTDANGIGHYDEAALKMGYGDMVEVFTDAANAQEVANWAEIQILGWPIPLRIESFGSEPPSAFVYTDWPRVVGGVDNLQRRADVPYTSLRPDSFLATQGLPERLRDAANRPVVPYMFCSDEQADLNPDCLRYDQGADVYETIHSVTDNYWNYYIFNNFRRQRLGFNTEAVFSRTYGRYFEKLQQANQIYALYRPIFTDIFEVEDDDPFWTAQNGMGAWTAAAGTAFGTLARVITAPEPGAYAQTTRPNGSVAFLSGGTGLGGQRVNSIDGRFMETTWDFDAGYFWFDQLDRVGYFYDKLAALMVLTDPTTYFLGRDTDADIRRYQINFASSFGPAVTGLMRGVLAEEWSTISPRFVPGGLRWPTPAELASGGAPGVPVDPAAGFSIQLFSAVLGISYLPQTYDQDFLNRSRIWIDGADEAIDVAPGTPTIRYTDSASGQTFVAVSYEDGGREQGVGARMLRHALALQDRGSRAEERSFVDNLQLMRRLSAIFGAGVQPLDPRR